ncbi:MAG: peptide chain release factor N(5)-glutamine methyltransferase [Proteobacteria bacterium]|nr:peptide chain release factor N(5)-glutamine methyltransferase [Pseudomonadota bacterium]
MDRPQTWTILSVLKFSRPYLEERGVPEARLSVETLLSHVLSLPRLNLYTDHERPLTPDELAAFKALLLRRAAREPVAYITGNRGFWSLDLAVTPDVLIPRPETEHLVEEALSIVPRREETSRPWRVLDLGTGSGAIVLALASERPGHFFAATDASAAALAVARNNARRAGLADAVAFVRGSWLSPVREGAALDLIVSNPPYIASEVLRTLEPEVRDWEPAGALDGGPDGLSDLGTILSAAPARLAPGGWLLVEMGHDQADGIAKIAASVPGLGEPRIVRDYARMPRVAVMQRTG